MNLSPENLDFGTGVEELESRPVLVNAFRHSSSTEDFASGFLVQISHSLLYRHESVDLAVPVPMKK